MTRVFFKCFIKACVEYLIGQKVINKLIVEVTLYGVVVVMATVKKKGVKTCIDNK